MGASARGILLASPHSLENIPAKRELSSAGPRGDRYRPGDSKEELSYNINIRLSPNMSSFRRIFLNGDVFSARYSYNDPFRAAGHTRVRGPRPAVTEESNRPNRPALPFAPLCRGLSDSGYGRSSFWLAKSVTCRPEGCPYFKRLRLFYLFGPGYLNLLIRVLIWAR
jgi:hypothetical protein